MFWYVIFSKTGSEEKVQRRLNSQLNGELFSPFVPRLETIFKKDGKVKKEVGPMFPGYVFIETELPYEEFSNDFKRLAYISDDMYKVLKYGDSFEYAMRENEKEELLRLCNHDYCIESSTGIIAGDRVYIHEGGLKGMESIIKKIDRHKRQAIIELEFMGAIRDVKVGLEILQKM